MRVHLLLILFFASTILARNARNKRDTNETTIQSPTTSTTEANLENTTDVIEDKCDGINCENNIFNQALKKMSKLIKSLLESINNTLLMFLKALNSTGDLMLRTMMQPLVTTLTMMIKTMQWMLHFL